MPPKKATQARSKTPMKTKDDEVEEEEEEKPTPKRSTSATKPAKAEPKTKASSAKNGTSKAPAKAAAKKTTKAKKAASESESEEESPAPKSPLKKASPPKKEPPKTAPAKTKAKPQAKKDSGYPPSSNKRSYSGYRKQSDSEEDSDDEKPVKKQQTKRSGGGTQNKDIDLDANIELDSELVIKDNLRVHALKGQPAYDYYEEYQDPKDSSVKMFFHMQVLDSYKSTFRTHFFTFFRWGKVGEVGECSLRGFLNRRRCIKIYEDKIEERKKIATNTAKKKVRNNVNLASQGAKDSQTAMNIEKKDEPQQDGQKDVSQNTEANGEQKAADNGMEEEKKEETNQVTKSQPDVKKTTEKVGQPEMEEEKKKEANDNKEETKEQAKPATSKLDLDKIDCPVDKYCVMRDWTEVLIKDDEIFDVKYGVSEIQKNSNQFYTFQLIRSKIDPTKHYIFSRYGRTGLIGKWTLRGTFTEEEGIAAFRAKQNERKEQNKYTALDISYAKNDPDILNKAFQESVGKSKLHKKVAEFIQLIFDFKMMSNQMARAGYDAKKLPLGNLSFNAINKGFVKLSELSEAIKNRADEATLEKLSSEFFTVIPQNVGWQNMKTMTIRSNDVIKEKLEFLDSLRQIQIAYQMVYGLDQEKENPIDTNYKKLKCDMEPVDSSSDEYVKIKEFIDNTKENFNLEILEMFKINKHGAEEAFKKDLDNHVMLWHGSRLTNFVGILSQGLRIAPPEAPVSGYRLGKGVYLADMISKSVPYCYASGSNNIFCIMVCESALGTMNEKLHDDFYASNLPAGKHSTKALGRVAPPLESYKEFGKGIVIPSGKPEKSQHTTSSFQHNEFIVYDVKQVQIRYLLKMKQNRW